MTKMKKPQIGLVGCFQNGKSTLTNCLLGARVALTGEGVSRTKKATRYVYGETFEYRLVGDDGVARPTDAKTLQDVALSDADDGVAFCEVALPSALLKDVDIIDTPGFDATDKDNERAFARLANVDFLFFVVGGGGNRGGFNEAEKDVLQRIVKAKKTFSVLYNCCDSNSWSPRDEATVACVRALDATLRGWGVDPSAVGEEGLVLPVNLAWYWTALVLDGAVAEDSPFEETEAERKLRKRAANYFFDDGFDSRTLIEASNIDAVKRYVAAPPNAVGILKARLPKPTLTLERNELTARLVWSTGDAAEYAFELQKRVDGGPWSVRETETREWNDKLERERKYEYRVRTKHLRLNVVSEFSEIVETSTMRARPNVTCNFGSGRGGMFD